MENSSYIITSERLGLRRWVESDHAPVIEMNRDPAVMQFFPDRLTPEETMGSIGRIALSFEQNGYGLFIVEKRATGQFLGVTGFARPAFESFFTPCVEIGWRFTQPSWGNGYATEAALACLDYGFQTLHLDRIVSFTAVLNRRSEKVMQRIGLTKIGEFDHPNIAPAHALSRHVVYGLEKPGGGVSKD